ncbi:uncharacterized protein [Medicago truncatula]|uniref:uncharacterized protein n=1 Tax=Medicago truncatula TaxID=3880 RepID=UPI000D2F46BE|nr:uncharacterized protein LOC112422133 [Medicago truncatula]
MIVRSGARWKIGNNINIPMFEAPWLRNGGVISGVGQSSDVLQNVRVHSLIDQNTNGWNYNMVNYYFDYDTVQEIIRTPIFHQVEEDALIWKAEKNGHYSVKRQAVGIAFGDSKVPLKVNNFLWRVCRDCLPTQARLLDKGVNCTYLCGLCEECYEDTTHVLFDCPKARNVWLNCSMVDKVSSVMLNHNTAAEIILALLKELTKEKFEQFAMNLWSLWKSRNLRIWQNISETCQAISARAQQMLVEWREANMRKQKCSAAGHMVVQQADVNMHYVGASSLLSSHIKWTKPQQGKLKCNIDAAFSEDLNHVGFGLCIRDAAGNFRKAKMMWSNPICRPEIGEALGLLYAIQWVYELQLTNVDFEMDAKLVVDYFNKGSNNVSEFGAILEDCKRCRNVYFENSKVEFKETSE